MSASKLVTIADIIVECSRKPVGGIDDLMASIAEVGLLQPIVVTLDLRLVAGLHRLRACGALGWEKISATVVTLSELQVEAATLDENLVRRELTVLERGEMLRRRKELHEALHPETRRGIAVGFDCLTRPAGFRLKQSARASLVCSCAGAWLGYGPSFGLTPQ